MPHRRYIPKCPTCRYDLSGLADGSCPECGNRFRHADLRAAWEAAERSRPKTTGHEALYVAAFLAAPPCCLIEYPWGIIATSLMWILAVIWCIQQWDRLRHERAYWLLWILLACARSLVGLGPLPVGPVAVLAGFVALGVLFHAFRHTPVESGAILFGALTVAFLPLGLIATIQGAAGVAGGHYWGALDRPRNLPFMDLLGPSHVRAMTNHGTLRLGLTATAAGLLTLLVAAAFGWKAWKQTSKESTAT